MVDWFSTALDCVDVTYISDRLLDQLPTPAPLFHHLGATATAAAQATYRSTFC
jgi:hypothetical protein